MNLPVTCLPCQADGYECEYYKLCLARRTDPTIVGCGIPLYAHGALGYNDVTVMRSVTSECEPVSITPVPDSEPKEEAEE